MKSLKLLLSAFAVTSCINVNAQSVGATKAFDQRLHLMLEVKTGAYHYSRGGFGTNLVLEKEVHEFLALDFFSIDFAAPFNCDIVSVGVKTGVRGFSPRWWDRRMRAYSSLTMGYDCGIITTPILPPTERAGHGFAFAWGCGIQYQEHLFIGYDLEYSTAEIDKGRYGIAHYAKIGWRF